MDEDIKLMKRKMSDLWANPNVKELETKGQKYAIMSDMHIGDGGPADDIAYSKNKETLLRALNYYKKNGFKLILLGDVEELWQFDLARIVAKYETDLYANFREFGDDEIYRVFGNHDMDWQLQDPIKGNHSRIGWAAEALKLKDKDGEPSIILVHGHQGSILSEKYSWISRIFVRGIWRPLEPLAVKVGLFGHPSATKSQIIKNYEQILYSWAKANRVIVICGHSHRAIYASRSYIEILQEQIRGLQKDILEHTSDKQRIAKNIKEIDKLTKELASEKLEAREIDPVEKRGIPLPCYFNCGCTLYSDGLTTLEIADDIVKLVKWHRQPKKDQPFEIYQDGHGQTLSDYIKAIKNQ
jgi:UDP-2,3-diacylglucosamine pyrophosphatase LpxH